MKATFLTIIASRYFGGVCNSKMERLIVKELQQALSGSVNGNDSVF